jgi:tRNA/tmRNA/rRNA uracil-C5-methylase (TrmA/RlmC/RlmD family)
MEVVAEITGVAHGGDGVCRVEEWVCFVPYALPGDRVRVRIERRAKGVLWGAIEEVLEPSPFRVEAAGCCPLHGTCSACGWLHFSYPGQAEWKQRIVTDSLKRIAGIEAAVEWVEAPELRLGYRTRGEFHGDGERWGFYLRGTRELQAVRSCPLCHPRLNEALDRLWKLRLRDSVEITVNPEGQEMLVWTKRPNDELRRLFPESNALHDGRARRSFFFDGVPIVNGTFSQSSLLLNRLLVGLVRDCVGSPKRVLDLYCGNGNFSLGLGAERVLGFDHNRSVVEAAAALGKGEYLAGDENAFRGALREGTWDVVLIDPPRTGAKGIVGEITPERAESVVYISCDPATLARDLKTLTGHGWKLARVAAVDMFPNTPHVETVCRLEA